MTEQIKDGGPAFPPTHDPETHPSGMTLRQFAAIKLRVPNSGTDWLDEMIRQSLNDEFAANALAALIGTDKDHQNRGGKAVPTLAKWAYEYADAMLKAREAA
jgi:hypothetical protein